MTNFQPFDLKYQNANLKALVDDFNGLTLYIGGEGKVVDSINFESYVTYRNSDESERYKFIKNNVGPKIESAIYTSRSSDYLNWIIKESQEMLSNEDLKHYLIITPNDIVEVISFDNPTIHSSVEKEIKINLGDD